MDGIHVAQDGVARKVERFMRMEVRALALEHIVASVLAVTVTLDTKIATLAEPNVWWLALAMHSHTESTIAPVSLGRVQYTGAQRICRVYVTLVVV